MRRVVLAALAACGGSTPVVEKAVEPEAPRATRVPVDDEDDESEDGVEFVSSRGRMDPAAVEAGIAPHTTSLTECYTTRVGKRRWLGGHVALHWEINKAGEITRVVLAESDLGAWPVEKCLLEVARSATFGKPSGGDADFSLPLDFSAKGRSTTWDEDQSLRAVGGQLASLDACATPPGAKGGGKGAGRGGAKPAKTGIPGGLAKGAAKISMPDDVTITIYVGPLGKAQSVGFASATTVLEDEWADCAEKTALSWRLPDPRGTVAKLAVRYRAN